MQLAQDHDRLARQRQAIGRFILMVAAGTTQMALSKSISFQRASRSVFVR
jgi:hypothetical protein